LAKKAKYPQCRGKGLKCYEREISKAITKAKSCGQVKKNDRQARFLVSLGRFRKLPFGVTEAKTAAKRLHRQACGKQQRICRKPTRSCRL
jgi:hypothetical protein